MSLRVALQFVQRLLDKCVNIVINQRHLASDNEFSGVQSNRLGVVVSEINDTRNSSVDEIDERYRELSITA